jgi:hypothetical protein
LNGLLSTEAAGLRVEGRNAARSGSSDDSCPYPSGDWRRLEWRIGFIGFDRPVSPALVQQAYNARRRSARRRGQDMSAPVKPETTGKLCKLASCRSPIPWNARVSKAKNEAREFCCPSHQHAQQAVVAAERRAARAAVDPKGAYAVRNARPNAGGWFASRHPSRPRPSPHRRPGSASQRRTR